MALVDLSDWMDEHTGKNIVWYVKRLSGNDTLATGAHQAGPYIPKDFILDIFPSVNQPSAENPDKRFSLYIDSHGDDVREVRVVWYNNKRRGGTRNETRLTNFGGIESALLDPENTGALAVFAFHCNESGEAETCHVWVCVTETDAELVETRIGPVEPGQWIVWSADEFFTEEKRPHTRCWLQPEDIPPAWLLKFPTGAEIIHKTIQLRPGRKLSPDIRLIKRRDCEFEIFRSVEEAIELPAIKHGFTTIDDFVARAQTILQRRKSRSGRSLELHAREIFIEEHLKENQHFQHQPESEPGKRPDFLFPNEASYKDRAFDASRLRMLAIKTTCKDRWRQVLNEASRIKEKHLLTLQEGVSEKQFREMEDARVRLVVPAPLVKSYPEAVRSRLLTLEDFIKDLKYVNQ